MHWVWQDIFSLDIPERWDLRQKESLIEITPPEPVGVVHISVLKRTRVGSVRKGEAKELVSDFTRKQGVENCKVSETGLSSHAIAQTNFETSDDQGSLYWHVEAHVWQERALVCSLCFDGINTQFQREALAMLRSIAPTNPPSVH
jgi:hypothetical protein